MSSKTNQKKAALSRRLFPNTKCQELLRLYLSGDFLAGECSLCRGNPFNFQQFKTLIGWNNSLALPQAIWFLSFFVVCKSLTCPILWVTEGMWMSDCPHMQGWASGETGMGSLVSDQWGSETSSTELPPSGLTWAEDAVLMMCTFLGIFIPIELFREGFLLVTALVSPGDSQ